MEPGVPFALLGAVQLLAIAAGVGLAAAGTLRRTAPGFLVAAGALGLVAVEVDTALRLGDPTSDNLSLLRAAASLVVAAGLWTGGLGPRRVPTSMYGVVVPLAAAGGPAVFAGGASLLAAVAALWNRRDAVGASVAAGFGFWAAAAFVSPLADSGQGAPLSVAVLRGLGAVAVLLGLALLAQASLLSKVVGAILAGVLAMAIAAVGVVGNVVVDSYEQQARDAVRDAASARIVSVGDLQEQASRSADLFQAICSAQPKQCGRFLTGGQDIPQLVPPNLHDFLVRVPANGTPTLVAERDAGLGRSAVLGLKGAGAVSYVLGASGADKPRTAFASTVRLTGSPPALAVVGVAAPVDSARPLAKPSVAYVYGIVLDTQYAQRALDIGGYGIFLLTGDPLQVVASNKNARLGATVRAIAERSGVATSLPEDGLTIGSQGSEPSVAFRSLSEAPDQGSVGVLAVTRDAGPALEAERRALRLLVLTALLALLAVAVAAAVLGRRTIGPVRQLTAAAQQVAAGDLTATAGVRGRDEVGTLARTFDDMTASLGRLTGDLRDSAARLQTVLASMSDGLLATDASGLVTSVNRAALEMLGLEDQDVLGEHLEVVADVRDAAGASLVDTGTLLRDEPAEVHRPDGTTVPVRVALTPLQGVEGIVMVLRDTTREREVERMKTEFLSNVSHELRTPLTPIRGYAEILVGKPGLDPAQVMMFSTTIRDEALKMNRVVDLLVDVAALEAGRVSVTPRTVPVRELLDARVELWHARAPQRKADIKRRVAGGLPALSVDPTWVGKALDELVDNAVKYTPPGTAITLTAALSPDGHRVRVSVKDAGPGIAEADQPLLFTSFEQVDGSATRRVGGLGLGLSFVRRLAEDAGFPLTVTSRVGKGSEFALDLPVAERPRR